MQKVLYFTKTSKLIDLATKLSAEINSEDLDEATKKELAGLEKPIHELANKLMSKCFSEKEYAKSTIDERILVHTSKHTVSRNPQVLKQSILSTLEKIFEILDDEKIGLKNTKRVFLDTGVVNDLEATIFKNIKTITNKIEKVIGFFQ